jgi:small subunit ribosomal protein S11
MAEENKPEVKETKQESELDTARSEAMAVLNMGGPDVSASSDDEKKAKKAPRRSVPAGIAFIKAGFNNTIVSIADARGGVIAWSSAGKQGFKGSRKSTAYAAQVIAGDAAKKAQLVGMREVEVRIKGPGAGRESAVRGIAAAGLEITSIKDITPVPHNGCRPPKRRRV